MKIVHGSDEPMVDRPGRERTGKHNGRPIFNSKILYRDPTRADAFAFKINDHDGRFKFPRHHHNLDQH